MTHVQAREGLSSPGFFRVSGGQAPSQTAAGHGESVGFSQEKKSLNVSFYGSTYYFQKWAFVALGAGVELWQTWRQGCDRRGGGFALLVPGIVWSSDWRGGVSHNLPLLPTLELCCLHRRNIASQTKKLSSQGLGVLS